MQPKNQKPPWCPMNPKRQRPGPIDTTTIQIALCACLIGNSGRYLHGIAQFSQSFTHICLREYPCIVGLVCNEWDALDICCLRPNELEYHKQQEVLPVRAEIDLFRSSGRGLCSLLNIECSSTCHREQDSLPNLPPPSSDRM
jgi:hypothetical protein